MESSDTGRTMGSRLSLRRLGDKHEGEGQKVGEDPEQKCIVVAASHVVDVTGNEGTDGRAGGGNREYDTDD